MAASLRDPLRRGRPVHWEAESTMALTIESPGAARLAAELAARTGSGVDESAIEALRERLAQRDARTQLNLGDRFTAIATGEPLQLVRDAFSHTDVTAVEWAR